MSLIYNNICTFFLVISIYISYDIWLKWSITIEKFTKYDTIYNTGLWKVMLFEMVINAVAPSPFFDGHKYHEYV